MSVTWERCTSFWRDRSNLKMGWIVAAGIAALYVSVVRPYEAQFRGISNSRATGLAAQTGPLGLWRQMRYLPQYHTQDQDHAFGVVGGVLGGVSHGRFGQMEVMSASLAPAPPPAPSTEDRKMVRTASLDLVVKDPGKSRRRFARSPKAWVGFWCVRKYAETRQSAAGR